MQIKNILIFKLSLTILCLSCSLACLILKILSQGFFIYENPLQYTSCSLYIKGKYSNHHIIDLIQNIQLILIAILGTIMTGKCLYIIFKQKPQKIDDLTSTIWIKAEFIMSSIIITFLVCLVGSISSALKEQQQCNNVHTQNFVIYLILITFALIMSLILTVINLYLIYKTNSHLQYITSSCNSDIKDSSQLSEFLQQNQILKNLYKMQNQNIFDMDTTQIRQQLLNQHTMPDDQNIMNGLQFGNKFSKFQKNYQTRLQRKIKKLKQRQALLNGNTQSGIGAQNNKIQKFIDERFVLGPQDELDPVYDRQKVSQISRQVIQKLQKKGYSIQERPYIQRTILSKKFKAVSKDQKKQDAKKEKNQAQELPNKEKLHKIPQQNQQFIQIVINLDTRQEKAPDQCYTGEDLESLKLDRIFYKQYIQKQKREKQQQRLKLLKLQKQKQLQSELQNAQRLKCSYQRYINQDQILDRKYQQALQYASKKKQMANFAQKELSLHLKLKSTIQLQKKNFHEEINKYFKDQIKNNNTASIKQIKQMQSRSMRKRRSTQIDPNNIGKFKDRKNPLQIIRCKGALN